MQLPAELHYRLVRKEVQTVQGCTEPLIFSEEENIRTRAPFSKSATAAGCVEPQLFSKLNILSVPEGLEDLSVQVVAAVDQVWITVSQQVGWRRTGWVPVALKHPFQ